MTKRWVHRNLRDDGMIGGSEIPIYAQELTRYVLESDHEQALAEKDLQWKRRVGLDCGGHSCFYAIDKAGMRHNGPCSCNPKRTKEDHDRLYAAYQQLMGQAVRFATELSTLSKQNLYSWQQNWKEADIFLSSPEVQAFLKERGHGIP